MTKVEFIWALHIACPAFMRYRKSWARRMGRMLTLLSEARASLSDEKLADLSTEVERLNVEVKNKWPKWPNYLSAPPPQLQEFHHSHVDSIMKGLEIFNQAKAANVELDPILAYREVFRVIAEDISEKLPESWLEEKMGFTPDNEMKENLRQRHGEFLFRRAAIVIPVYPHYKRRH
jgi:hypothetical protein